MRVSALGIDPKDPKVWQLLVPGPMLSVIEAKVELPRSKKILPLTLRATKGEWVGEIADLKAYRLFVVVTFMDGGEKKRAKIQIEREP